MECPRVGGEHRLQVRFVSRDGAIGMTGRIDHLEDSAPEVDSIALCECLSLDVVTPVEVVWCQLTFQAHMLRAQPTEVVDDLDRLGHRKYFPRRFRSVDFDSGIRPLEIWNDTHVVKMRMEDKDLVDFPGVDANSFICRRTSGKM